MSTHIVTHKYQNFLQAGLREKLAFLKQNELEWLERMDTTSQPVVQSEGEASNDKGEGGGEIDPEDDFKREMHL